MKRIYLIIIISIIIFGRTNAQELIVKSENSSGVSINLNVNSFSIKEIPYRDEILHEIVMDNITLPNDEGKPNLPFVNHFIAIPHGAKARVIVNDYKKEVIENINIAPSRGYFFENEKEKLEYEKNSDIYSKDEFYPAEIAKLGEPKVLRGLDAVGLSICPVQYNPVKKELIVYKDISISVEFEGGDGNFGEERYRSPYWDPIYERNILNYSSLPKVDYEGRMQRWLNYREEGAEYVILTPNIAGYKAPAQMIADYRKKQGIITKVLSLNDINVTSPEELEQWVNEIYTSWEIVPVAICLLGDHNTDISVGIPSITVEHSIDGQCISDNAYADVDDDNMADICFSRIIASDIEEAYRLVNKILDYEYNNPNMNPMSYKKPVFACGWAANAWFQLCSESIVGYHKTLGKEPVRINGIYDEYTPDIWSGANNSDYVYNYFGPDGLGYIPSTPDEAGGFDGGTGVMAMEAINEGTYIIQHRDHGWNEIWYQPQLDISNLTLLENTEQYPFMISVNCRTGIFNVDNNCLIEEFIRRTHSNKSCGVVGAIAPTAQSYSFSNDTYAWGIWDFFENSFLPHWGTEIAHNNNYLPAFANVSGKYFLAQMHFPNSNSEMMETTYNIYHAHCDAFLRLFSEVPQEMSIIHNLTHVSGNTSFPITAPEGCMVALYTEEDDEIRIIACVEATGESQMMQIPSTIEPGTSLKITATGQNYLRYENEIIMLESEIPHIILDDFSFDNGDKYLIHNEDSYIDINIRNIGMANSSGGNISLSCDSDKITITNNNTDFNSLPVNEYLNIENAFFIDITEGIPNDTDVKFTITFNHDDHVHSKDFYVKVISPSLDISGIQGEEITGNGNNFLDPGEYGKFTFSIVNNGNYICDDLKINMLSNDGLVRVIGDEISIESIGINDTIEVEFEAYIEWEVGIESNVSIRLEIMSGEYIFGKDFDYYVGCYVENFENGIINNNLWNNDEEYPWRIDSNNSYEGIRSLRSGSIIENMSSSIQIEYNTSCNHIISFYYRVSSEANFDHLNFFIDNNLVGQWSGETSWAKAEYFVGPGDHLFKWEYAKDYSYNSGDDCAWIDLINFPASYDDITENRTEDISIYPNPSDEYINISCDIIEDYEITIYNTLGIKVLQQEKSNTIDISQLPSGVYIVEIKHEGGCHSERLIIE